MAHFIKYNGYSPGTGGYGFWLPKSHSVAASDGTWRSVLGVWIAHAGVFNPIGSSSVSDMTQVSYGTSSYCGTGARLHQTQYKRWASFQSPIGNTKAVEVQWRVDGGAWSASDTATALDYSTAVVTISHEFPTPLGPGTGIDDGNDHAITMQWRSQNTADSLWSSWHGGGVNGFVGFNEAGC